MSISMKASMAVLKTAEKLGILSSPADDPDQEMQRAEIYHKRHRFAAPSDRRAYYREVRLAGYPCLIIRPRHQRVNKKKAILYLHGGIRNEWKPELSNARGYGRNTGVDVWYPIFPSVTEVPITKTIDVIYKVYRKMAKIYGPENVALIGGSLGGFFAFQIINQENLHERPVGMPGLLIAHSPGGMPASEEEWNLMRMYAENDPIISIKSVEQLKELTAGFGEPVPDYALSPVYGDYHHAPETYVFYGEETCAGNASSYVKAYKRDDSGEKMHMHIESGAMHCYAQVPVLPESRRDYRRQIRLLKTFAQTELL